MAAEWLALLKQVPWREVIRNSPLVVNGAKKLWSTVEKKKAPLESSDAASPGPASAESKAVAALEARASALEASVSDLHSQMLASSELINALAEQNAQLIRRIEASRVRMLWLGVAIAVVGVIALSAVMLVLSVRGA